MTPTKEDRKIAEDIMRNRVMFNARFPHLMSTVAVVELLAQALATQRVKHEEALQEAKASTLKEAEEAVSEAINPIEKVLPCAGGNCQCENKECFYKDTLVYGVEKIALTAIKALESKEENNQA